jgi:hypothetical protein
VEEEEQLNIEPENIEETEQPEGVETEQEVDAPSVEGEVEEIEVSIDGDDEHESDAVPVYKYSKLRRKNKKLKSKTEQLEQQLAELQAQVGTISRGEKPSILDYSSDEDYEKALNDWQGSSSTKTQQGSQPFHVPDDVIESHYERAAQLGLRDYQDSELSLRSELGEAFDEERGNLLADEVIRMAGDKSHLVAYALGANGGRRAKTLISKLQRDNASGTNEAMEYVFSLKNSAKVGKKSKNLTTQPETMPQGKGNADALQTQVKQAYNKWLESGSAGDHQRYKELKKQTSK